MSTYIGSPVDVIDRLQIRSLKNGEKIEAVAAVRVHRDFFVLGKNGNVYNSRTGRAALATAGVE